MHHRVLLLLVTGEDDEFASTRGPQQPPHEDIAERSGATGHDKGFIYKLHYRLFEAAIIGRQGNDFSLSSIGVELIVSTHATAPRVRRL
jgi:hypothetical protein